MGRLGLVAALVGFTGAGFVFVDVQVLQSFPFHSGVFGNQPLILGLTYTLLLEVFGVTAGTGLFVRAYATSDGTRRSRFIQAAGRTLLILGLTIAIAVYAETHLLWGEILPGVHLWQGLTGGGGYPWGGEQVAYNLCFVSSSTAGDCTFLNYDELFLMASASAIAGYVIRKRRDDPEEG